MPKSVAGGGLNKPLEPRLRPAIPLRWGVGLALLLTVMLAFVVLSIEYGSQPEVDAFLAEAEICLTVLAVFGINQAVKYRVQS